MQEQKGEERSVAKIKIYKDEPVFSGSDKFLIREKSNCIQRSGDPHSYGETRKQDERKLRIRRSVEFSPRRKPVATRKESGEVDLSDSETESEEDVTGKAGT